MMRFAAFIGCLLLLPGAAISQGERNPDGSDVMLKSLAEDFKDKRTLEQIKKDNVLIRAAAKGDLEAIRKALNSGALINSRYIDGHAFLDPGESGLTALMFAVLNKRTEAIKLLIENKAGLEIKEYEGQTALDLAVYGDQNEAIDLLVKAGAKQDPVKIRLYRDLFDAACKGFKSNPHEPFPPNPGGPIGDASKAPDIVAVLKRGADVNKPDSRGYTALMYAANLGLVENVKTLLANGADATLKSPDGETALSLAETEAPLFHVEERRQVVKVLKEHLAKKR
jgi:uncharacterized protein